MPFSPLKVAADEVQVVTLTGGEISNAVDVLEITTPFPTTKLCAVEVATVTTFEELEMDEIATVAPAG